MEAVATLFRDKGIPLTWVGLPIVQDETLSAEIVTLNEVFRSRAVKAGATYVDSWQAFVDEGGKYSQFGPDVNGRMVKLRLADGIDFTRAGTRKLASFVEPDIRQARDRAKAPRVDPAGMVIGNQPGFDSALDIDINAQIRREAGLPARETGREPAFEAVGPVVTITAPAIAADGRLVDRAAPALAGNWAQRALVEGVPVPPRRGRMDDFAWPK